MTHRTPALVARFSLFTVCLFAVSLSTGCANESTPDKPEERLLPSSSGTHHDLAIFCNDKVWFDGVGLAVAETFAAPVNGLPQAEKRFLASQLPHKAASSLIKRFKSVLSLQIIPDSSGIVVAKDVWARPQMVVQVIAPNAAAMARIIRCGGISTPSATMSLLPVPASPVLCQVSSTLQSLKFMSANTGSGGPSPLAGGTMTSTMAHAQ